MERAAVESIRLKMKAKNKKTKVAFRVRLVLRHRIPTSLAFPSS